MLLMFFIGYFIFVALAALVIGTAILKERRQSLKKLAVTLLVIVTLPFLVGYIYVAYFSRIPEVMVPNLVGVVSQEALNQLETVSLRGRCVTSVVDSRYHEGAVVSQHPEAGKIVKIGRLVDLTLSSGVGAVVVPNLLGRSEAQARAVLQAEGLAIGKLSQSFVPDVDSGMIMSQDPLPGEKVAAGTAINLTVASSDEGVRLLEIMGVDEETLIREGQEKTVESETAGEGRKNERRFLLW
ncbi:hypothetical protein COT42_08080 [Candidatus Saganbacteria bacterium CG08_land_8_20_14_0_20_45_16]|uniref:PASTA domain-containing protein n=1 Tax=Candidatus Saganbacteria bacterium CG08_land_8_20_14_0_20_45_16 TaxID=2014293 RepID=A0A2H0XTZ4_UNCSA|nr:MAG: hypothetical protein COT42_08080 [Candidatus Saganbacteria bacterium CG08_land_8_20_14_0_20_45_16]